MAVVLVVAATGVLAGHTSAQSLTPLQLEAAPADASATPNTSVLFRITLTNPTLVGYSATLNGTTPPGWLYEFTPAKVDVPAKSANTTTLAVFVPADASVGAKVPLQFQAWQSGGIALSEPLTINVTITAPPPPPAPSEPTPPKLALSIAASSAHGGDRAAGILALLDSETTDLRVTLTATGGWPVEFPDGNFIVLRPNKVAELPIRALVPSDAPQGATRAISITATTGGFSYSTIWNVEALSPLPQAAPTPPTSETTASDEAGTDATTTPRGDPAGSGVTTPPDYALEATPLTETITVASGDTGSANIRLTNAGQKALTLTLSGDAADHWPVVVEPSTLTLEPGVTRDVRVTITAPAGVNAGGKGSGTLTIQGNNGLLRTVPFQLAIVEPVKPIDAKANTADAPLPPVPALDLDVQAGLLIAGGAATIGGAALIIARRPLREKLIWGAVGLYTRLARPDVLGHEEREKLYKTIETQGGIHFHALQRELAWNTGTLTYHLRVLERHGFVVSRRDGPYRRFYLQGSAPKKETFNPDAPHGLRADVLEAIRSRHGISQTDLAMALGANKQTVNYHVKALERGGTIRLEKRGRETFLYMTDGTGRVTDDAHA